MTIVRIFDCETTGMEPPAEICEVGICDLHLEEKIIRAPDSWLCRVKEMPPEVRAIHHITKAECEPFPPFGPDDSRLESGCDAIAMHNAAFDSQFFTPFMPLICTYKAALRAWPDAPSHSNGALRYWLEDQGLIAPLAALTQPAHRAGPDAYVTAHILLALFNAGHTGKEMIGWTRLPALLPRCPLSPHKGKAWADVDYNFLTWMSKKADMDSDLRWNADQELARRHAA